MTSERKRSLTLDAASDSTGVMSKDPFYAAVVAMFGSRPKIAVWSPTEYRVTIDGYHVHNGAASGGPLGDGRSLEDACRALLAYVNKPSSLLVEGSCSDACHARYNLSPERALAHKELQAFIAGVGVEVRDNWPAWKRGLPPCTESECEREMDHIGKNRKFRTVKDEW